VYLKVFDLIDKREDIKDHQGLKKIFLHLDHSKKKFKFTNENYERFLQAIDNVETLACFYRYLHNLAKQTPANTDFILDLEKEISEAEITLNEWLKALMVIDDWLKKNNLQAGLIDIKGYIACLYEYQSQQNQFLGFSQYILLMLEEYGFEKAFSS